MEKYTNLWQFKMKKKNKSQLYLLSLILIVSILALIFLIPGNGNAKSIEQQREDFILQKQKIQGEMLSHGDYACCLEKPCTYCIEKSPGHGEGAACHCLEDIVNGKHPCGECIGEILEGHGNPYLVEYFPEAIAEEIGEEYKNILIEIMEEKYGNAN